MSAWARIRRAAGALHAAGLAHIFLAIVSIQGATYVTQLLLAGILAPESFAVVRKTESVIALLLVVGSAGMPSLAIALAGKTPEVERGALLRRLVEIAIAASLVVAAAAAAISFLADADDLPVARISWLIAIAAVTRVCFSYFQGIQAPHRASAVVGTLSLISVPVVCVLANAAGLPGWILGRYTGEALMMTGLVVLCAAALRDRRPSARSRAALVGLGAPVVISLLMRTALEQTPILLLGHLGVSRLDTAYYGFATLIVTALLLVSGAIVAVLAPRFSARVDRPAELRRLFIVSSVAVFGTVAGLAVVGMVGITAAVNLAFPSYHGSVPVLLVLLACAPIRAAAAVSGLVLLSVERNVFAAIVNVCMLAVQTALMFAVVPRYGMIAAAWVVVVIEVLGAIVYLAWAWRQIGKLRPRGTP